MLLYNIVEQFVKTYPLPGQAPELDLIIPTHDPNRDNSKFRLSDAGKCHLMRYWKRQGKETDHTIPAHVLLQMQVGNIIHAYIEHAVSEMGYLLKAEGELEDEHTLGHFDMLIQTPGNSVTYLYDIKTISSKKAYYMDKNGGAPDTPHIMQIISYANMLEPSPDNYVIAYVVRDTMAFHEEPVDYGYYRNQVNNDWNTLIKAWKYEQEPKPNPARWECQYCQYQAGCEFALVG